MKQAIVVALVVALLVTLGSNIADTLARLGIRPGFDFLWSSANFEIGESLIAFKAGDSYARAILVGLLNTVRVAALGCVLATVLGVILGIARLSPNRLLSRIIALYVELVRNVPLLLQLFFWSAVTHAFPPPRQALRAFDIVFLSNRGIAIPAASLSPEAASLIGAGLVALMALWLLARRAGPTLRRRLGWAFALGLAGILAAALVLPSYDVPSLKGFNIRGGWQMTPEFSALLIGLVVKFSASIAEITRSGIQSVGRGQWEAARSLGLRPGPIMRLIVLPQALRVIIPQLTSSYLDLTKDSSLAVAIGYPDLVNIINTSANTTGQSLETLGVLVAIYLVLNLSISAVMNRYNRRMALRGLAR